MTIGVWRHVAALALSPFPNRFHARGLKRTAERNAARRLGKAATCRRTPNTGFTLVEMLVVMSIFSLLLASVSVALATLWRAQSDVQNELQQSAIVTRLASQLRADGHLAHSAVLGPPAANSMQVLRLTSSDWHVEYALELERIVRTAYSQEQLTHREVYPLAGVEISCTVNDEAPPLLTLSLGLREPHAIDAATPSRSDQIEVAVGLLSGKTP